MQLELFNAEPELPFSFSDFSSETLRVTQPAGPPNLSETDRRVLRAIFFLSEKLPESRASDAKLAEFCGYKSRHTAFRARKRLQSLGLIHCRPRRHNRRWSIVTEAGLLLLRADPYLRRHLQQLDARLKPIEQQQKLPKATTEVARSNNHVLIKDLKPKLTLAGRAKKPRAERREIKPQVKPMEQKKPEPEKKRSRVEGSVVASSMVWQQAKDVLRSRLPWQFYDAFIETLEARQTPKEIVLHAPDNRHMERIKLRYEQSIRDALKQVGYAGGLRIQSDQPAQEATA
jgi:hypothetical protein